MKDLKDQKNMDLMSDICSTDHNQPNNRSASLKVTSRTQSKPVNKATPMAHTERSLKQMKIHRLSDYFNCCDRKVLSRKRSRRNMFWEGIVVFSVVVFINVASINCNATRQVEGEFIFLLNTLFFLLYIIIFMTLNSDLSLCQKEKFFVN